MSEQSSAVPSGSTKPRSSHGKGALITGAVLLGAGLLVGLVGVVGVAVSASNLLSGLSGPVTTPTTISRHLDAGTSYSLYQRIATEGEPDLAGSRLTPSDITITGPGGKTVPSYLPGSMMQRYDSGSSTYVDVASFDVPSSGVYAVVVRGSGATVVLGPSINSLIKLLPWIILIVVGGMTALAGFVTLIVGIVRRSASHKVTAIPGYTAPSHVGAGDGASVAAAMPVAAAPALPPSGWYPDPSTGSGVRYWDGSAWTEYRA